ncbi:hypothetical protein L7F22_041435 [Adiantum nelumboides]|nr:hypothetical protein [Adiantum nelumboides]
MASLALASAAAVGTCSRLSTRSDFCVRAMSQESKRVPEDIHTPGAGFPLSKLDLQTVSMQHLGRAALTAAVAAVLTFTNPALAFKGGGPYGQEVTRGLDLSGKDFSGKTLIKQDFKASNLRQTSFKGAKLLGASFFDANLTGVTVFVALEHSHRKRRFRPQETPFPGNGSTRKRRFL